MSKPKHVIKIDCGTQSGGTVIVDIKDGCKIVSFVTVYSKEAIDDY